jgi:hypothetical protein
MRGKITKEVKGKPAVGTLRGSIYIRQRTLTLMRAGKT